MIIEYPIEELLPLLQRLIDKYTSKESTSVPYYVANQLLRSILYAIQELDEENSLMTADLNCALAYEIGLKKVKEKIEVSKQLYERVCQVFSDYGNKCCKETIIDGISVFFQQYDPVFNAEDHLLTMDYPLIRSIPSSICGIDLIAVYLNAFYLEQKFLNLFDREAVTSLFKRFHNRYQDMVFNQCQIVWRNAVGCMLVGQPVFWLSLTAEDIKALHIRLSQYSAEKLEQLFETQLQLFVMTVCPQEKQLLELLRCDIPSFAITCRHCLNYSCLENIFLPCSEADSNVEEEKFIDGTILEDEQLRKIIAEMGSCRFLSEKISMIQESVKSLEDLKEVLKVCFLPEEYQFVFALLNDTEREMLTVKLAEGNET